LKGLCLHFPIDVFGARSPDGVHNMPVHLLLVFLHCFIFWDCTRNPKLCST